MESTSDTTDVLDLACLLNIWPIAESFARHTPVGDLITLARTNTHLRSSLHGQVPNRGINLRCSKGRSENILDPEVGRHQTNGWVHLKSLAPFNCSSTTHTRGQELKPCVYCSKPICDACIVRDSFKHRGTQTFKNRLRYFCNKCWSNGQPTRNFRYPAERSAAYAAVAGYSDDSQDDEKSDSGANEFCECNHKQNGWLCLDCKAEQNSSPSAPTRLMQGTNHETSSVPCFGLDCTNTVDLDSPEKDRRRVCLWCQKPLRRQYSGEDRYAWNLKTIEARARNAESRSRDLEEYNRRRLQVMRMSRYEMRGTTEPGDKLPMFVRHLDTVNYRNWMPEGDAPDPNDVWKSKNGYWRYRTGFLIAMQNRCARTNFGSINGVTIDEISKTTQDVSLPHSRVNRDVRVMSGSGGARYNATTGPDQPGYHKACLNQLKARILHMVHEEETTVERVVETLNDKYDIPVTVIEMRRQLEQWSHPAMSMSEVVDVNQTFGDEVSRDKEQDQARDLEIQRETADQVRSNGDHGRFDDVLEDETSSINGEPTIQALASMDVVDEHGTNPREGMTDTEEDNEEPPPYFP